MAYNRKHVLRGRSTPATEIVKGDRDSVGAERVTHVKVGSSVERTFNRGR